MFFMFFIALLLCLLAASEDVDHFLHDHHALIERCSREISRKVQNFLEKEVFPLLPYPPTHLPPTCALNPLRNIYQDHEKHKSRLDEEDWKCTYCNKRFVSEYYLDKHLFIKHPEYMKTVNETFDPTCLTDLCPIFGCRAKVSASPIGKSSKYKRNEDILDGYSNYVSKTIFQSLGEKCTPQKLQLVQTMCEQIKESCFPDDRLRYAFDQRICQKLQCSRGMLTGAMKLEPDSSSSYSRDILYRVFKYMLVLVVLIVACFQISLLDIDWTFSKRSNSKKDLVGMYVQKHKQQQQNALSRFWYALFPEQKKK